MDNDKDIYDYWMGQAYKILQLWIEAGMEGSQLFAWALEIGGQPFIEAIENLTAERPATRVLGIRRKHLLNLYESWETESSEKIAATWSLLLDLLAGSGQVLSDNPYLTEVVETFGLSGYHRELISYLYLNQRYPSLYGFLEDLSSSDRLLAIELACPSAPKPHSQHFRKTEVLRKSGLVEASIGSGILLPYVTAYFQLEQNVFYTLSGDTPGGLSKIFFSSVEVPTVSMEQFPFRETDLWTLNLLLTRSNPSLILFHGEPGTGKTEFAKALSRSVSLEPAVVNFDSTHKSQSQLSLVAMASRFLDTKHQILVVDEADQLLNSVGSDSVDKGLINVFLDEFQGKGIFITNSIRWIDRSVLRRFNFTMPFKSFTPQAKSLVWGTLAKKIPVFKPDQLEFLASTYEANPSQIKNALEISMGLKDSGLSDSAVLVSAQALLESSQRLLWKTQPVSHTNGNAYSLEWLNLDTDPAQLIETLGFWKKDLDQGGQGLGLLFNGPPGTGKTLFGKHLAQIIGLPFQCKKASDLISPYVGETEANIRSAFEASEKGVLMIDEADSFFFDRSKAHRSWERSQVNEILQALESFRGLFIATTNFQQVFDESSFRRFSFKVSFMPLTKEQRITLVQAYFPTEAWSEPDLHEVSLLEGLTPGDVEAVHRRLKYLTKRNPVQVIRELDKDLKIRSRSHVPMGFKDL